MPSNVTHVSYVPHLSSRAYHANNVLCAMYNLRKRPPWQCHWFAVNSNGGAPFQWRRVDMNWRHAKHSRLGAPHFTLLSYNRRVWGVGQRKGTTRRDDEGERNLNQTRRSLQLQRSQFPVLQAIDWRHNVIRMYSLLVLEHLLEHNAAICVCCDGTRSNFAFCPHIVLKLFVDFPQ
jgi:hypothetical protein